MSAPNKKKDESYKDYVIDALSDLDGLRVRAMFGGYGLYLKGVFFGIIWKGRTYFKVDDETRPDYVKRGGKPFRIDMRGKR
ncbi:MAG: hypothetical protein RL272_748 [Candidatus Parcubacteria bacterium]|jgi:DNA transformation protein